MAAALTAGSNKRQVQTLLLFLTARLLPISILFRFPSCDCYLPLLPLQHSRASVFTTSSSTGTVLYVRNRQSCLHKSLSSYLLILLIFSDNVPLLHEISQAVQAFGGFASAKYCVYPSHIENTIGVNSVAQPSMMPAAITPIQPVLEKVSTNTSRPCPAVTDLLYLNSRYYHSTFCRSPLTCSDTNRALSSNKKTS